MIQTKKRPAPASVEANGKKSTKKLKTENHAVGPAKKDGKFVKSKTPADGKQQELNKKFVANTPESKKEYWNGLKAKQKELREQRRKNKAKDLYELSVRAKRLFEQLKRKTTDSKDALVQELHELLGKDNVYGKVATSHDTARVVQCMIKNATEEMRGKIMECLLPSIYDLSTSKYGHHCINSLLKHGSKAQWVPIVNAMIKHVVRMVNQTFSSALVDAAYNEYATNEQRMFMRQAFYSELYQLSKDSSIQSMKDCWKTNGYMKKSVLSTVKGHLVLAANKKLTDNSLLHALLAEFLQEADTVDRSEIIELYAPLLSSISSTKDGTNAAIFCFVNSLLKDRRAALKAMKPYIPKLSVHEHGHRLVMCVLNCYDDTKVLAKQVISGIMENLESIVGSGDWGRKVVGWIFSPCDRDLLHPAQIELLDGYMENSKKDKDIRRKEVFAAAAEGFCKAVESNGSFWMRGGHTSLLTVGIVKQFEGKELLRLHTALASVVCNAEWKVHENEINLDNIPSVETVENGKPPKQQPKDGKLKKIKKSPFAEEKEAARARQLANNPLVNGVEHAGIHIALKKLIKLDTEKRQQSATASQFGQVVVDHLTTELLKQWISQNRPSFLLLLIFENGTTQVQKSLKSALKSLKPLLVKQKHTGAKLLMEKLKL